LTFDEYAAIKATNWSTLRAMAISPKHYQYALTTPRPDTPAMRLGRAVHTATLEPDVFPLQWTVYDGRRAGKVWDEFAAVNADKSILTVDEYETALAIRDAVHAHKSARRLLRYGKPEVSLRWVDKQTRQRCKGRLDWLRGDTLIDLKTSRDVDPHAFGRTAAQLDYHGQLAFYRRGLLATGHNPGPVYIIAVENSGPFDVMVYEVDDDVLAWGDEIVGSLLHQLKVCRKRRSWPGRDSGVQELQYPSWALPQGDAFNGKIEVLT
jgi:hypothetical protein